MATDAQVGGTASKPRCGTELSGIYTTSRPQKTTPEPALHESALAATQGTMGKIELDLVMVLEARSQGQGDSRFDFS